MLSKSTCHEHLVANMWKPTGTAIPILILLEVRSLERPAEERALGPELDVRNSVAGDDVAAGSECTDRAVSSCTLHCRTNEGSEVASHCRRFKSSDKVGGLKSGKEGDGCVKRLWPVADPILASYPRLNRISHSMLLYVIRNERLARTSSLEKLDLKPCRTLKPTSCQAPASCSLAAATRANISTSSPTVYLPLIIPVFTSHP